MSKQCLISHDPKSKKATVYLEVAGARGELRVHKYYVRKEVVKPATLFAQAQTEPRYVCEVLGESHTINSTQTGLTTNQHIYTLEEDVAIKLKTKLDSQLGNTITYDFDLLKPDHRSYESELSCFAFLLYDAGFKQLKEDYHALEVAVEAPSGCIMM